MGGGEYSTVRSQPQACLSLTLRNTRITPRIAKKLGTSLESPERALQSHYRGISIETFLHKVSGHSPGQPTVKVVVTLDLTMGVWSVYDTFLWKQLKKGQLF
ncbi:hypothetical protein RRG08_067305 [Elysia crispata]|uniref:Uncharacterized protein n=1 Tax=Elysia crispata TaxID=231223 RepID=A0AAE1DDP3_9GAST|nr:hypothetical protein RRG08_067305 [Elysia crispata]